MSGDNEERERTGILLVAKDGAGALLGEAQPGVLFIQRLGLVLQQAGCTRIVLVAGQKDTLALRDALTGRILDSTEIVIDYDEQGDLHALSLLFEYRLEDVIILQPGVYVTDLDSLFDVRENTIAALVTGETVDGATERFYEGGQFIVGAVRVNRCPRFWSTVAKAEEAGGVRLVDGLRALPNDIVDQYAFYNAEWGRIDTKAGIARCREVDARVFQRW
jgi:hypothetical protein